jgi:predicted ester cyclase
MDQPPEPLHRCMSLPGTGQTNATRNKQNYLDAKAAFNRGDLDACMVFYAEDHQVRSQDVGPGRQHIQQFLTGMRETWGDLRITVEHAVAEGDWVMGHCRSTAIHNRPVMGLEPTGRRIEASFWDLRRFDADGLIAETWNISDRAAIMTQLAAIDRAEPGH